MMRVNGELIPLVETKRLMQEDTIAMAFAIMSNRQKQKFKDNLEIDLAYSVPGLGRFRCNVFQQRGTVGLVLRVIPVKIMTVGELGLPLVLEKIAQEERGLVLVHRHDRLRQDHDAGRDDRLHQHPALRAHHDGRGPDRVPPPRQEVDRQPARGRGGHALLRGRAARAPCARTPTSSWSARCATSRRSRPRLTAAETGHLVFSTLHTLDATETINRIIAVFPPHQQKQIRLQLAGVLKAVISSASCRAPTARAACRRSRS